MLPSHYKLWCYVDLGANDLDASSNANEDLTVTLKPWKLASDGSITYGTEITRVLAADVAQGGASVIGAAIDNSTDKNMGFHGTATVTSDDTTHDGVIELYMEWSTDGGTDYPSSAANFNVREDAVSIGAIEFNHDGTGVDVKSTNLFFR